MEWLDGKVGEGKCGGGHFPIHTIYHHSYYKSSKHNHRENT